MWLEKEALASEPAKYLIGEETHLHPVPLPRGNGTNIPFLPQGLQRLPGWFKMQQQPPDYCYAPERMGILGLGCPLTWYRQVLWIIILLI